MKVIDQINGSALFAQSAFSASIATNDSLGRNISETYLTGVDLTPYQTTAGMTAYQPVGDYATTADLALKQDTLTFGYDTQNKISAINNSAIASQGGGGGTTYTSPSGTILINDDTLEATTSAIGTTVKTVEVDSSNSYFSAIPGYPFDTYSAQSTDMMKYLTLRYGDWSDGFTVNDAMTANTIEIPLTSGGYDLWLYNGSYVRISAVKTGVVELAKKDDLSYYTTIVEKNALSASISSVSSNLYELSGKTFTGSTLGTILVEGQNIEASTSAVTQMSDTTATTNYDTVTVNTMPNYPYSTYKFSFGQYVASVQAIYGNYAHTEFIDYNAQGVTIPTTYNGLNLTMVGYGEGVLSGIKSNVVELATKSDLPTYEYDSTNKISAINGSAIAGGTVSANTPLSGDGSNSNPLGFDVQSISADLARMLGVDETVLWETTAFNGEATCNLSEPYTNFKKLKVLAVRGNEQQTTPYGYSGPWWEYETDGIITGTYKAYGSLTPAIFERKNWKYSVYSASNTQKFVWCEGGQKNILTTAAGEIANTFTGSVGIKKIVGVNRKQ